MPRGSRTDLPPTPAALRDKAARARGLAHLLMGDEAEQRLLDMADELEARADALEVRR